MAIYALQRFGVAVLVMLCISALTFGLARVAGDPAASLAGEGASSADIELVRHQYGLDRPLPVQYLDWLGHVARGDFGESFRMRRPVVTILAERLPTTLTLAGFALVFALALSLPLGIAAAVWPRGWIDRFAGALCVLGQAVPTFWLSLMLIIVFGVMLRWLPISGNARIANYVLPAIALGIYAAPAVLRLTRTGMREALESDYIRVARAKGLRPVAIVFKHALRNAMVPVVAVAAVQFGFLLTGSIVVETVFAMNGLGYLAWESITRADLPVLQTIVFVLSLTYALLGFVSDMMNALLDPRLRSAL